MTELHGQQQLRPRERVMNAIQRKPNDRVPYDFRAEPEVYQAIRTQYGLPSDEAVRVWAQSDIRDIGNLCSAGGYGGYSGFGWQDRTLPGGIQEDFWGVQRKRVAYDGGEYIDICHWPLRNASFAEIRDFAWPDPEQIFDFSSLRAQVHGLFPAGEYWCMIETESIYDRCWALRGMEQIMEDFLAEPEIIDFMLEQMGDFFYRRTQCLLEAAQGCIDAVGIYNDLGTQDAMMISPALYREFIKPRQRRYIEMVKQYGVQVFYHSCGAVEPIYPDLIEIGVDIIDPLQMAAMRVTPEYLKATYGAQVTLHGGLNTQGFLPKAMPEEVRRETRHLCEALGQDGGYILSGSHFYQVDIPLENIAAIHQTLTDTVETA